jgi:hypothetical protein
VGYRIGPITEGEDGILRTTVTKTSFWGFAIATTEVFYKSGWRYTVDSTDVDWEIGIKLTDARDRLYERKRQERIWKPIEVETPAGRIPVARVVKD